MKNERELENIFKSYINSRNKKRVLDEIEIIKKEKKSSTKIEIEKVKKFFGPILHITKEFIYFLITPRNIDKKTIKKMKFRSKTIYLENVKGEVSYQNRLAKIKANLFYKLHLILAMYIHTIVTIAVVYIVLSSIF